LDGATLLEQGYRRIDKVGNQDNFGVDQLASKRCVSGRVVRRRSSEAQDRIASLAQHGADDNKFERGK
jgi:hypothetical protein